MANIFTKSIEEFEKPNKNTFNRSFTNNITMRFGEFTPCFVKEVMPSQSVRIKPTFGFNMHPLVFPVQTKIRCNLHFFYVRNRPLWKGWMDFFGKTENIDDDNTPPYIDFSGKKNYLKAGSLFDNIGIPCTVVFKDDFSEDLSLTASSLASSYGWSYTLSTNSSFITSPLDSARSSTILTSSRSYNASSPSNAYFASYILSLSSFESRPITAINLDYTELETIINTTYFDIPDLNSTSTKAADFVVYKRSSGQLLYNFTFKYDDNDLVVFTNNNPSDSGITVYGDSVDESLRLSLALTTVDDIYIIVKGRSYFSPAEESVRFGTYLNENLEIVNGYFSKSGIYNLSDVSSAHNPYYSSVDNEDGIKVSALPLRAYEAIYNSFYRDERNNPLIIDGKEIYNKFTKSTDGGPSTSEPNTMYKANWMPDAYTTAVQTPQQGDLIPLVGVTATGLMTFEDENGKSYTLQANLADDGTLTGIQSHSSDMPTGTLRAMVDSISTGISINDFRNVNALQRWLEKNVRRGLRYKDIVETHFGNKIKYSEVDVPEFIGGVSRMVDINKVVQTSSDAPGSPLGTLAGIGNIFGDTDAVIQHYCDEPGWIIGIISVVPEPVYSQRLDKQLTKMNLLDYYFPEFAHIGYQPIFNQELTPLQLSDSDGKRALDVFGYQRPWHEYISSFDEVHGDFQTNMRDYLIQRVFGDVPQLCEEFLLVDRDIANAVFADKEDNAKIFGQIYFDFVTQIPIPKYGIPRLEA